MLIYFMFLFSAFAIRRYLSSQWSDTALKMNEHASCPQPLPFVTSSKHSIAQGFKRQAKKLTGCLPSLRSSSYPGPEDHRTTVEGAEDPGEHRTTVEGAEDPGEHGPTEHRLHLKPRRHGPSWPSHYLSDLWSDLWSDLYSIHLVVRWTRLR